MLFLYIVSILGMTAGVHRLWSHRSYKAKLPLKIILAFFSTIAYQNSVFHWAREHRVHHKFSETNADPVNAARGFFYSHVGWLLCKKHPDVVAKGSVVDISDLLADPVLAFQKKYYGKLTVIFAGILPLVIPVCYWNETWRNSFCIAVMLRWILTLNATWLVNSAAHMFGNRPYDMNINPTQCGIATIFTFGEGYHNYHHVFPWDYKASEFGAKFNLITFFINCCTKFGWAYDLKSVSSEIIQKRANRTGDGSIKVWGWEDDEQDKFERENAVRTNRKIN